LIQALEDVEIYQPIEQNVQIRHYIDETKNYLRHMVRIVNVKKSVLISISFISDFSYAWGIIEDYLSLMQTYIRDAPKIVLNLKNVFMKLASIMNIPLERIIEADSEDLVSVSSFYSGELVKFVKQVL
jgi:WASH complex subunit strumpellin